MTSLKTTKRQGNIISALMSNFDIARDSLSTAQNSDGSAEKELSNYQKSIQYSVDKFKASFQELSSTAIGTDFIKNFVEVADSGVNGLTKLIDKIGLLKIAIGGFATFKGLKNLG